MICVIFYNPFAVVRVIEIPFMKPVTVIWPEFIADHDWYHLLALISREKVASNWTISSCSTMVAKKWTLARSGNGGHNRRARPSLLETATRGFIDSRQTFVRPRFVLGRVNNWGISVADREAVDFKTFHFGLLAEISLWAITCNAYDLEWRIVNMYWATFPY